MPTSGFFTVLRDVAKLAASASDDLAAQSSKFVAAADDVASLTGKAAIKTAGVAGDDLAVGAGQVGGISAARELPAVMRIAKGSAINKVVLSLALLVLSSFAPAVITVLLVMGAVYLAFEGGEALCERLGLMAHASEDEKHQSEDDKVKSAVRTDMVLSAEILVISLSAVGEQSIAMKAAVLFCVSVLMTVGVYGLIALIIRLDDMGLALARSRSAIVAKAGRGMAVSAPVILRVLEPVGMVAMFAVAGGIFSHLLHIHIESAWMAFSADIGLGLSIGLSLTALWALAHRLKTLIRQ